MKSKILRNKSAKTIVLSSLKTIDGFPLVIQPHGCAAVSEETCKSTCLQPYLGVALFEDVKVPVPPPIEIKVIPPKPIKIEPSGSIASAVIKYSSGMHEEYLKAPGITAENVDMVLVKFPSKDLIVNAYKWELTECGVAKSYVSRLKEWAKEPTIPLEDDVVSSSKP